MKENTKLKITLALLTSLSIALLGAVVWGLVLSLGVIASVIAYVTAFLMLTIFNFFYKDKPKLGFVWCIVWVTILNTISLIFYILIELHGFSESFRIFFTDISYVFDIIKFMIKEDPSVIISFGISIAFSIGGVMSCKKFIERKKPIQDTNIINPEKDTVKDESITKDTEKQ